MLRLKLFVQHSSSQSVGWNGCRYRLREKLFYERRYLTPIRKMEHLSTDIDQFIVRFSIVRLSDDASILYLPACERGNFALGTQISTFESSGKDMGMFFCGLEKLL